MRRHVSVGFTFCGLVLVLVLCGSTSTVWAAQDKVYVINKADPLVGTVNRDTLGGVEIALPNGGTMTPNSNEVDHVDYDLDTTGWKEGTRALAQSEYGNALAFFRMAVEDVDSMREPARAQCFYNIGECAFNTGQIKDAEENFQKVIEKFPASRYFAKSLDRLVSIYVRQKNFNKIAPLVEKLRALGGDYAVKATFYDGELLVAQDKPADALPKFKSAEGAASSAETKSLARLGQARCLVMTGEFTQARTMAEQALSGKPGYAVSANAYVIIGNALYEEAMKASGEDAKNKLMDAVIALQRVPALYPKMLEAEAEAWFRCGECFKALIKNPIPDTPDPRNRAVYSYTQVVQRFPNSRWADEAKKQIEALNR